MERVLNAPVAVPKEFSRPNERAFRQFVESELAMSYRKDANVLVPYGKSLGFLGATGKEVIFGLDGSNVFSITVDGETIISFSSSGDVATLEITLRAEFEAADADLSAAITVEAAARTDGDAALATLITTVETDYIAADAIISASVTTEASARSSADSALASLITALDAAYQAADVLISASVTTEASARASADSALSSLITALDAAYQSADTTLQANITSEASARASADTAIASSVTTLTATVDGKNQTFVQTSAPTAIAAGDLWIDSDDNNRLYRATAPGAGSWVAVPYTDTGKVTTFAQTTAPTATAVGDLWIDTDDDNKVYRATAIGSGSWVAVDDARISITATTLATVQGYLSASYTIELDVNGRATVFRLQDDGTTSDIIFKADTFFFYDGVTDRALFEAGGGLITIRGDLDVEGSIRVGDIRWPVALQPKTIYAEDGDAIEWANGAALSAIPNYTITPPNGVALASGEAWEPPTLQSVTTTGGTLRLKIATPGSTSSVTDTTDSAGGGGDPDRVMEKADSADAHNGVYNFTATGTITIVSSEVEPGSGTYYHSGRVVCSTWFNDGGGWDEGPEFILDPVDVLGYDSGVVDLTGAQAFTAVTRAIAWANAVGQHGAAEWGMSYESGGSLTDFVSVQYLKQTVSGTRTGSPNGEEATILVLPRNI
jgi:hypothetical protein